MRKNIIKGIVILAIIIAIISSIACESKSTSSNGSISTAISEIETEPDSNSQNFAFQAFDIGIELGRWQVMVENYYEEGRVTEEEMAKYNAAKQAYEDEKNGDNLNDFYYVTKDIIEEKQ